MFYAIIDNSHILSMLVARLGLFKFNRKFTYFISMHQRMGNGAVNTDLTNVFSNDDFWSTLLCRHPSYKQWICPLCVLIAVKYPQQTTLITQLQL